MRSTGPWGQRGHNRRPDHGGLTDGDKGFYPERSVSRVT